MKILSKKADRYVVETELTTRNTETIHKSKVDKLPVLRAEIARREASLDELKARVAVLELIETDINGGDTKSTN